MAQFEKELRYLDLYLGLKPDNNGEIPQTGRTNLNQVIDIRNPSDSMDFAQYISYSHELDCDSEYPCLWTNSPRF